ncbi:MAG: AbiH family protein [Bacteroidota bacterium]
MNRLILIGNGFDLAHGLETSYNAFILWYIKRAYKTCLEGDGYCDQLIELNNQYSIEYGIDFSTVEKRIDQIYDESKLNILASGQGLSSHYNGSTQHWFITNYCSKLLMNLLTGCSDANWVDIENEYYRELIKTLDITNDNKRLTEVKLLNGSMQCLIDHLYIYINSLTEPEAVIGYDSIFDSPISVKDVHNPISVDPALHFTKDEHPKSTLILNFNYSSTLTRYSSLFNRLRIFVNHIHGRAVSNETALIFGFGDELDDNYTRIEKEKVKGFFSYMKSFGYFKTSRYRELVRYIDSGPYQVFVLGHSCGLSDRTMLNMVFEHDNCWSIKVYYHKRADGTDNYTELTQEISRHFKNKANMRVKVVDFEASFEMPQV